MPHGLPYSLDRRLEGERDAVKKSIILTSLPVVVDGLTGIGWGTLKIGNFAEGNISFLGAVVSVAFLKTTANITATWEGDFAIGTTPATDATLTAGDVDIVPSTATGAATAGAIAAVRATHAVAVTGTVYDNTAGTLEINFNLLVDDAAIDADTQSVELTGSLDIAYQVLGDD
jgi:hypothetical protein